MFRPPFRPVLVVAAVTATALLGACSDDTAAPGPTADATTTTSTAAPTTTTEPPAPTTEDEVAAAFMAAASAQDQAFLTSDPADAGIAATRVEPSLSALRDVLADRSAAGLVLRYPNGIPPEKQIRATRVLSPTTAELTVCVIDNAQLVRSDSGAVVNAETTSRLVRFQLVRSDGTWKVRDTEQISARPGSGGCEG